MTSDYAGRRQLRIAEEGGTLPGLKPEYKKYSDLFAIY
jgi:hypothetical protein